MKKMFIKFSTSKWNSRMLFIIILATTLLGLKWITAEIWLTIALAFTGENFFSGYYRNKMGGGNVKRNKTKNEYAD